MCGRYVLTQSREAIAQAFDLPDCPELTARFNIAPGQAIAVIGRANHQSPRQLKFLRWGLIPRWAKDTKIGDRLINARSETVADKPSFREAFQRRRCLVIADGFYEWQSEWQSPNKSQGKPPTAKTPKQPYYFRLRSGQTMAFAGLWESWQSPDGEQIRSCTILTTEANDVLKPIHHRMPVILRPEDYDRWIEPATKSSPNQDSNSSTQSLQELLQPYSPELMECYPVSPQVNRPGYDSPDCITPQSVSESL